MAQHVVYGNITNMATGEAQEIEWYPVFAEFELTTLVRVDNVESYSFSDDSMQVSVDWHGLDSVGMVFDLSLAFFPQSTKERDKIVRDWKSASYFLVKGKYGVPKGAPLSINNPEYRPIEPAFLEDEINEVFRINGRNHEKPGNGSS